MGLDDIDWAILDELQHDGRVPFRELGQRVGLSAPAVAARVRKLEQAGVITGYRAVVDLEHLGLDVLAFVRVSVSGRAGGDAEVIDAAGRIPEILDLYRVSGAETYLLRVALRSVGDLERVLRPFWQIGGETITGVVLSEPIADRPIVRAMVDHGAPAPKRRR